jgi:hypothetical protein
MDGNGEKKPACINTQLPKTKYDNELYKKNLFGKDIKKELISVTNINRIKDIITNIDTNPDKSKEILRNNIHYLLYTDENNDTLLHKLARFSDEYPSDADFDVISSKSFGLLSAKYVKDNFYKIIDLIINDEQIKNKLAEMEIDKRFNIYCDKPIVLSEINNSENDDVLSNKINKFFNEIKDKIRRANYVNQPSEETKQGGRKRKTVRRRKRKTPKKKRGKSKRRRM